jgi:NADPH:quinone reductase-like Zn-dependent oxidoreductase
MASTTPASMRAVVLAEYRENLVDAIAGLRVAERSVPTPRRGQVLVRIEAAPCNPSDLLLLQGKYGALKTLPTVPGWEGSGSVVASGGGFLAGWLVGKRVACALRSDRDGTWAEYFVADANSCVPIKPQLPIEQAACLIINPLTAMGLLDTARREGHRAAIHTAAASQLGRMLLPLAEDYGFPLIHVVRRDEHVGLLKSLGAIHVLNSSEADFADRLKHLSRQLSATVAFEAVAGELTGTILNAMPRGATVYVYGGLSQEPCGNVDPIELIFQKKTVTGFYLGNWLKERGTLGTLRAARRLQQLLIARRIETRFQRRLKLKEVVDGLHQYVEHMTRGKVLIEPHAK